MRLGRLSRFVIALVTIGAAGAAQAADTDVLRLQGSILDSYAISVTALPASVGINLNQNVVNLEVATIHEYSNVAAGYKVSFQSRDGGLKGLTHGGVLPYSLSYGVGSTPAITRAAIMAPVVLHTELPQSSVVDVDKTIWISFDGDLSLLADEYEDLITFTIAGP